MGIYRRAGINSTSACNNSDDDDYDDDDDNNNNNNNNNDGGLSHTFFSNFYVSEYFFLPFFGAKLPLFFCI
jgi:hypothetical protein